MLTSKQRAFLRGLAAAEDTIVIIGKGGITENIIIQMNDALKAGKLPAHRARGRRRAVRDLPRRGRAGHRLEIRAL